MSIGPKYPVIAISEGDSFLVVHESITECSAYAWRNGYFENLVFFDSAGRLWPVRATLRRPLRLIDRFRRSIQVDLDFDRPAADARATAVEMLETLIDSDDTDVYDQFLPRSELKARFRAARDPGECIAIAEHLGADEVPEDER